MKPISEEPRRATGVQPAAELAARQVRQAYEPGKINRTQAFQYIAAKDANQPTNSSPAKLTPQSSSDSHSSMADLKKQLLSQITASRKSSETTRWQRYKPLVTALLVGFSYLAITYNEVAVAQIKQYISPGSRLTTPVIVDPSAEVTIGPEPRIIIPKINLDVPVVYDITSYDEGAIQKGLERGVVHYGTTALPGQTGNNVIVGHSSNNFFNQGKYKFAFVLLDRLELGDTFILHYKGTRYIYRIIKKAVIEPTDFSLIRPTPNPTTTLITCTPPGTSWHRLVVQAEQISPDPRDADASSTTVPEAINTTVPGNAPSIWQRLGELFN